MITNRDRLRLAAAVAFSAAALALALSGCERTTDPAEPGRTFGGSVVDEVTALAVPALAQPTPDVAVGLGDAGGAASAPGAAPAGAATAAAGRASGSATVVRVATMTVEPGSRVAAGDVIATMDDALLRAQVVSARADLRFARARVSQLDRQLDDVADAGGDLSSAERELNATVAEARATRARLARQLAEARAALARIETLRRQQQQMPQPGQVPTLPPGTLPPGRPSLPDPAQLQAGIAQLEAAIARIDAGLAQAEAGRGRIESGRDRLSTARRRLEDARELARIGVASERVALRIASEQLRAARVLSPDDGVIVSAARAGEVLAPGATLAVLRTDAPSRVCTWLTPGELLGVAIGDAATVRADWAAGRSFQARLARIGEAAGFPPTSFSTTVIHLTRAVPVEVELLGSDDLPPGTPADVTFTER